MFYIANLIGKTAIRYLNKSGSVLIFFSDVPNTSLMPHTEMSDIKVKREIGFHVDTGNRSFRKIKKET